MKADMTLDQRGQSCPMPIVNMARKMKELQPGQVLELLADDEGAHADVPAWSETTGNEFLGEEDAGAHYRYYVRKAT